MMPKRIDLSLFTEELRTLINAKANTSDVTTALAAKADKTTVEAHKAENMPHQFINHKENKTYKFGFQLSAEGNPQIIFEEVV